MEFIIIFEYLTIQINIIIFLIKIFFIKIIFQIRLLSAAIDLESLPNNISNKENLSKVCEKMNFRNRMARNASRASSDYQTYLFFKGFLIFFKIRKKFE